MSFTLAFMFKLNTSLSRLTSFRMHNSCTITVSWDNRSTHISSYPRTWCHKFKILWGWTPFYLWILFLMCSSCEHTVADKQQSISTNIHLPEHSKLGQPSNPRFQSMLDEFYPVQARTSDIAYSQKCLFKGHWFGAATGVRQRRREWAGLCHPFSQIYPGKLPPSSQKRNKHSSESLTKGQMLMQIHG